VKDSKPTCIKTIQNSYARGITPLTIPKQSKSELSVNADRLVSNQSNYIKKLYRQVLDANSFNAMIMHDHILAEEAEINIQESTKGDKKCSAWYLGFSVTGRYVKVDSVIS
jgi:hypothetical protein